MKKFEKSYGDIIPINKYIEMVEDGDFVDYDGHVGEVLDENNNILAEGCPLFLPSETNRFKEILKNDQRIKNVVWYNK